MAGYCPLGGWVTEANSKLMLKAGTTHKKYQCIMAPAMHRAILIVCGAALGTNDDKNQKGMLCEVEDMCTNGRADYF